MDFGEILGISGRNTPGTTMPANRLFKTGVVGHPRNFDAEVFVVENLARKLNANASGTIRLVSERAFCRSCFSVIDQFEKLFPNIRLILIEGR